MSNKDNILDYKEQFEKELAMDYVLAHPEHFIKEMIEWSYLNDSHIISYADRQEDYYEFVEERFKNAIADAEGQAYEAWKEEKHFKD